MSTGASFKVQFGEGARPSVLPYPSPHFLISPSPSFSPTFFLSSPPLPFLSFPAPSSLPLEVDPPYCG